MGQMLNIVRFAELVAEKQGVSERFWEVLAPVVGGNKFNFRYLGEPKSPNRPKQKHVARRGHGKSPRKPVVEEEKLEEIEEAKKASEKRKEDPITGRRLPIHPTTNKFGQAPINTEGEEMV